MSKEKIVVLFSGGIDSTVLLYWLLRKGFSCYPLFIDYGQMSSRGEFEAVKKISRELGTDLKTLQIKNISSLVCNQLTNPSKSNNPFFPNRNLLLLSIAGMYAYEHNFTGIATGVIYSTQYPDSTSNFIKKFEYLNNISLDRELLVLAPFLDFRKSEVVSIGNKLSVPFTDTYSCLVNPSEHCLKCDSCVERMKALNYLCKDEKGN